MRPLSRKMLLLPALLCLFVLVPTARGQTGTVDVTLEKFGLESSFRPGDLTGIRLELASNLGEAAQIWVQIEVPNADGDVGEYGRHIALTPGQRRSVWIYVPLPADFVTRSFLVVKVFEDDDGQRGRELGGGRISPNLAGGDLVENVNAMIGVVGEGQRNLRLRDYTNPASIPGRPPFAHEDTRIVFGIRPEDLPDRWEGLQGLEALCWSTFAPRELTEDQARAIRRYVQRGGHLVIVLPATGDPWNLGGDGQNPLADLMPEKAPARALAVPLDKLLPVLSKTRSVPGNLTQTIHVFKVLGGDADDDRITPPYRPHIALDDGRVVAVQRTFGFGRITLLGIDVSDFQLTSVPRAVQADVLWNRILGRRVDTPSGAELADMKKADRLVLAAQENSLGGGGLFGQLIAMAEQASYGLLTALLVIGVYWIVAGPGGFWVLKQYKMHKHAWVAFAAAAGIFTGVAWAIVSVIKPSRYAVRHVTFLDSIARPAGDREDDPQLTRAASWFSLNMPGYRPTAVFLDSDPDQRDLIASWSPPEVPAQPFPNPDRFRVDVGTAPADETFFTNRNDALPDYKRPSRSTVTQLYANWMGGLRDEWAGRMIRVAPDNPATSIPDTAGISEQLIGELYHDLPGDLTDVLVIWIKSTRLPERRYASSGSIEESWVRPFSSGQMLNTGGMWIVPAWPTDTRLSLPEVVASNRGKSRSLDLEIEELFFTPYAKGSLAGTLGSTGAVALEDRKNYLRMMSLFNQLKPPIYLNTKAGNRAEDNVSFYRVMARELDLSAWFSGPCLIVIGQLEGGTNPLPLRVNGEPPHTDENSMTVVRWILPLPLDEKIAFPKPFERPDGRF